MRHPVIAVTGLSFDALIASGPGVIALRSSDQHQLDIAIFDRGLARLPRYRQLRHRGGLCPNLAPGTYVVARSIVTPQQRFAANDLWSQYLLRSIPSTVHADIAGGHVLISHPATKSSPGDATGAVAVDMESSLSAAAAARHNVPFAAVRVIADPSRRALPHVAQVAVLGNGRLDFGRSRDRWRRSCGNGAISFVPPSTPESHDSFCGKAVC